MKSSKRLIMSIIVAAVIVSAIAYGFKPAPIYVDVAQAVRAPLMVTIEEEGITRIIDRYEIAAPVAGYVKRIHFDVGDPVVQGETLFVMEPLRADMLDPRRRAEARARVSAMQSALRVAKENALAATATADLANTELARIQRLVKANHATQDEADRAEAARRRAEAALRSANFSVDVARHELEVARSALRYSAAETPPNLEQMTVRSPGDGAILKRARESEGVVQAGQVLLEVGQPKNMEVIVDVLSFDAVKISQGMPVELKRWGGEEVIRGEVTRVEPIGFTKISALGVEEQRVWVVVNLLSPYEVWQRLGEGYRVEASFILWRDEDVLQVPTSALFRYLDGWAVFTEQKGVAKRQSVEIGKRNGLTAQIKSGLVPGQSIITHPNNDIDDGTPIRTRNQQ